MKGGWLEELLERTKTPEYEAALLSSQTAKDSGFGASHNHAVCQPGVRGSCAVADAPRKRDPAPTPYRPCAFVVEMLAAGYVHVGRVEKAVVIVDDELARTERSGARQEAAELYGLKGEAILGRDPSAIAEAEKCFRKAIEITESQSAKWWELRATVSLARLLSDSNRGEEARKMLAEIYNWFTEGFDLPDLEGRQGAARRAGGDSLPELVCGELLILSEEGAVAETCG